VIAIAKAKRGNKPGGRETIFDGIIFEGQPEAEVYRHLKLLEQAGRISGFKLPAAVRIDAGILQPEGVYWPCNDLRWLDPLISQHHILDKRECVNAGLIRGPQKRLVKLLWAGLPNDGVSASR
jgi:hypothetical protein